MAGLPLIHGLEVSAQGWPETRRLAGKSTGMTHREDTLTSARGYLVTGAQPRDQHQEQEVLWLLPCCRVTSGIWRLRLHGEDSSVQCVTCEEGEHIPRYSITPVITQNLTKYRAEQLAR